MVCLSAYLRELISKERIISGAQHHDQMILRLFRVWRTNALSPAHGLKCRVLEPRTHLFSPSAVPRTRCAHSRPWRYYSAPGLTKTLVMPGHPLSSHKCQSDSAHLQPSAQRTPQLYLMTRLPPGLQSAWMPPHPMWHVLTAPCPCCLTRVHPAKEGSPVVAEPEPAAVVQELEASGAWPPLPGYAPVRWGECRGQEGGQEVCHPEAGTLRVGSGLSQWR